MVLGHEGVGIVAAIGPSVHTLRKGDRVGWGFLQETCGHCTQCLEGTESFCPERKMYGHADLDQGSLAYGIVKKEASLFQIPSELSDEEAAPLMCAGATVFNVFSTHGVRATDRVGVVGIGGLGHLAVQVCQGLEGFLGLGRRELIAFSLRRKWAAMPQLSQAPMTRTMTLVHSAPVHATRRKA